MSEHVPISDIARMMGVNTSTAIRFARKNGFWFVRIRTPESRGQATLALSSSDVERLMALRRDQGFFGGVVEVR